MFERTIYDVIQAGIDRLSDGTTEAGALLKHLLKSPGLNDAEIDNLVTFWNSDEGRPHIVHQFARKGAQLPLYAIVLAAENQEQFYLGDEAGMLLDEACIEEFEQLSEAINQDIDVEVQRWRFVYNVITYAENPDVCIGYHRVLRTIMLRAKRALLDEGAEEPEISGTDLVADPRYLADNVFTRQLTVAVKAHVTYPVNIDLGPLATGRGKSVDRIYVADNVVGVNPGVVPVDPREE